MRVLMRWEEVVAVTATTWLSVGSREICFVLGRVPVVKRVVKCCKVREATCACFALHWFVRLMMVQSSSSECYEGRHSFAFREIVGRLWDEAF